MTQPSKRRKMSNLNIYVGSSDERDTVDSTLSAVTALLELETYKGATSASLVRWLGKQDPGALAEALRPLRRAELQAKVASMSKQ
jgi:hypothetical protein